MGKHERRERQRTPEKHDAKKKKTPTTEGHQMGHSKKAGRSKMPAHTAEKDNTTGVEKIRGNFRKNTQKGCLGQFWT